MIRNNYVTPSQVNVSELVTNKATQQILVYPDGGMYYRILIANKPEYSSRINIAEACAITRQWGLGELEDGIRELKGIIGERE